MANEYQVAFFKGTEDELIINYGGGSGYRYGDHLPKGSTRNDPPAVAEQKRVLTKPANTYKPMPCDIDFRKPKTNGATEDSGLLDLR